MLFGTQRSDQRALALILDRIHALAPELVDVEQRMPTSHEDLLEIVERSDVVVATRYHGIVIGTLFGRPTIGVCYQAKSRRLLEMAGIAEFAVDVDRLSARALLDKLTSAIEAPSMSEQIRARALEMHIACWRGFDEALERCIPDSVVRRRCLTGARPVLEMSAPRRPHCDACSRQRASTVPDLVWLAFACVPAQHWGLPTSRDRRYSARASDCRHRVGRFDRSWDHHLEPRPGADAALGSAPSASLAAMRSSTSAWSSATG